LLIKIDDRTHTNRKILYNNALTYK